MLCAVLLLALCTVPAGAVDLPETEKNYIVVPLDEYSTPKAAPITGTIQQGETLRYAYDIPESAEQLEIVLQWQTAGQNDLSVRIIRQDQYAYGPYYDDFEGSINGIIPIGVNGRSFAGERLVIEINGYEITGTESFTLQLNAT